MTLSRWLRDYLYIPLGGNQKGKLRTSLNIFITMLLGGLWHGATWNFVLWGGLQGAGLVTERSLTARRVRRGKPAVGVWPKGLSILAVFLFVTFAWVLFRAPDLSTAAAVVSQLWLGIGQPTTLVTFSVLIVVAVGLGLQWIPPRIWQGVQRRYARMPLVVQGVGMGLFVVVVTNLIGQRGVAPFIYFQF
jgi:D-alanyl-lipoteichoic acid acyltransferase DltB (MBOAT superfamily)